MGRIHKVSVVVAARSHFSTIGQRTVILGPVPLFEVDKDTKHVAEIKPTTFPELGLWERQDLEAWVTTAPESRAAISRS